MSHAWRSSLVLVSLLSTLVLLALLPTAAVANCVMCARNAAAAGEATGGLGALLLAALVLLVPSLGIFAGVGFLLWKQR